MLSINDRDGALAALTEQHPKAFFIIDFDGKFMYLNSSTKSLLGWSDKDNSKMKFDQFFPEQNFIRTFNQYKNTTYKSNSDLKSDQYCITYDGKRVPIDIFAIPYTVNGKKLISISIEDITARKKRDSLIKKSLQKLAQHREDSDFFIASLGHEVRNPMSVITGCGSQLANCIKDESLQKYINLIQSNIKSMVLLIDNVLELTKLNSNKIKIKNVDTDLSSIFDELALSFSEKLTKNKTKLFMKFDNNLQLNLLLDGARIKQILINLITNALKNTSEGLITVYAYGKNIDDSYIQLFLEVTDNGRGIPEKDQSAIFDAFSQGGNQSSDSRVGVGIGLAICKQLISAMGGSISFESSEGKGTKFLICIPKVSTTIS
jgi:PAS domain S-box-containing protein